MKITEKSFESLYREALTYKTEYDDPAAYISDMALSSLFDDVVIEKDEQCDALTDLLRKIYDAASLSIREIRKSTGLSQARFATRYIIPLRTLEDWEYGKNKYPEYTKLLLAEACGLFDRKDIIC